MADEKKKARRALGLKKIRGRKKAAKPRNVKRTGAITLVIAIMAVLGAFQMDDLVLLASGSSYTAQLRDAAGLTPGTEVRVAGVKVGKITSVDLAGLGTQKPHVDVDFRIDGDVTMGDRTAASVRLKTVLGQRYLAIEPKGDGELKNDTIPTSRTATPLDVVDAVNNLADTVGEIDTDQLGTALEVLSDTFADTNDEVDESLKGISELSKTISSRNEELGDLLESARSVTKVLAERDEEFKKLVSDGNKLLGEVKNRKEAIHDLLASTVTLSEELQGLVDDQEKDLAPALTKLDGVVDLLKDNQENLEKTLTNMGPFLKAFSNVTSNGRWFDSYIEGLLQPYEVEVG
ncbi:MCE family protein [Stackebrandtia nassauensis]|uniref:Virulence factor Mce family protein n=1 Tax=Stackebrandtia nassauensis (strain DSM 44728 / CIP 108903 / NRRL B-16338 / NBRC 102104 / LLR-40K-21) TaxID=446470 RepID=D3QB63_STANL|nr:MCE family protein [Stackebrandtia nassauensis]ADD40880.1 virulence factor Mce family protein [Stackebrandtia nassauensis DSM 44728]